MSNEQLVAAYRDAEKNGHEKAWVSMLRKEMKSRGLGAFNKR
ncbi:sporulation histidine kinase inhibitor Sda [Bacillus coahuilensis]